MKPNPKQEAMQRLCDYWLDKLAMPEWKGRVTVKVVGPKGMEKVSSKDNEACTIWSAEQLTATTYMLRSCKEDTLVHEILHICLEGHTTYNLENYSEMHERALNRLAKVLIEGDRKGNIEQS